MMLRRCADNNPILLACLRTCIDLTLTRPLQGVTGKEAVFSAGADTESSYHGGGEVPCDLKGRPFTLKVDAMHKSKELKLLSLARPHMVSFYGESFDCKFDC